MPNEINLMCPECGKRKAKVIDSRTDGKGSFRRRRYQCKHCSHRFSTVEIIVKLKKSTSAKKSLIGHTLQESFSEAVFLEIKKIITRGAS